MSPYDFGAQKSGDVCVCVYVYEEGVRASASPVNTISLLKHRISSTNGVATTANE